METKYDSTFIGTWAITDILWSSPGLFLTLAGQNATGQNYPNNENKKMLGDTNLSGLNINLYFVIQDASNNRKVLFYRSWCSWILLGTVTPRWHIFVNNLTGSSVLQFPVCRSTSYLVYQTVASDVDRIGPVNQFYYFFFFNNTSSLI